MAEDPKKPIEPVKNMEPDQKTPIPDKIPTKPVPVPDKKLAQGKVAETKEEILERIQDIIREYNGKESDIPQTHKYWDLVNQYRAK